MAQATHISTSDFASGAAPDQEQFAIRPADALRAVGISTTQYKVLRTRLSSEDPSLDEQTLADTVEGLTDLHEILVAIIRDALEDEALASGLKGRIGEMKDRRERLQDRAAKRRQIVKETMAELNLKKITAPDIPASLRPGISSLIVLDENSIPSICWEPRDPKLDRATLIADLKQGREVGGAGLSDPEPILSVRTR